MEEVMLVPLWQRGTSKKLQQDWFALRLHLAGRADEDWSVWTDWYDARLTGGPVKIDLEVVRVLLNERVHGIWDEAPARINAEIRKPIDEHADQPKPFTKSREETERLMAETASPDVDLVDGKIDILPNAEYDRPDVYQELLDLLEMQDAAIRALLDVLNGNSQAPRSTKSSLKEYAHQLQVKGVQQIMGLLQQQFDVVQADFDEDEARSWSDGLLTQYENYRKNHADIQELYKGCEPRETIAPEVNGKAFHGRADIQNEIAKGVKEAHENGLVSDDFRKFLLDETSLGEEITRVPPDHDGLVSVKVRTIVKNHLSRLIGAFRRLKVLSEMVLRKAAGAVRTVAKVSVETIKLGGPLAAIATFLNSPAGQNFLSWVTETLNKLWSFFL